MSCASMLVFCFFLNRTATTEIYTLSYTTLFRSKKTTPVVAPGAVARAIGRSIRNGSSRYSCAEPTIGSAAGMAAMIHVRSEEHTSELQSHHDLVCRLLLEKKKKDARRSSHRGTE